jgi:hypothetical protein
MQILYIDNMESITDSRGGQRRSPERDPADSLLEIPLKCTTRLNALPKHIENRENSQLLNFNNFTHYNKIVTGELSSA